MKKLYLIIAAAAIISAPATEARSIKAHKGERPTISRHDHSLTQRASQISLSKAPRAKAQAIASKAVAGADELQGEYIWTSYDYTFESYTEEFIDIKPGDNQTQLKIELGAQWGCSGAVIGEIDTEASTLTIQPGQKFSYQEYYGDDIYKCDAVLIHYKWNDDGDDIIASDEPFVATIGDGVITFDPEVLLSIEAYEDDEFLGYLYLTDENVWTINLPDPDDTWTSIGKGSFKDAWIAPGYFDNYDEFVFDVEIERSDLNPDRIRIVDPYSNPLYSSVNISTKPGYIVIDLSDPEFVLVEPDVRSGFMSADALIFYCYNLEAYYLLSLPKLDPDFEGITKDEIREWFEEDGLEISTFKDNVVRIPVSVWGAYGDPYAGANWVDDEGEPLPMLSTLTLPETEGVTEISTGNTSAPVEYYNLQGVKVTSLQPGLYIRRQGDSTTKIAIR